MMDSSTTRHQTSSDLAPPKDHDPVIELYKREVDRTMLRENLKLTSAERSRKFQRNMRLVYELRRAGRKHTSRPQAEK